MAKIIGIDLGTTNSCLAIMEGDQAKVIENSEGGRTTPSIVAYTDGETLVGQSAKRQSVTNPENTLYAIKRLIGRKFDDEVVTKDKEMTPFKIVKAKNGDAWVNANGEDLAPQQVSAQVLAKMKKSAEDYLGHEVKEAVITSQPILMTHKQATKMQENRWIRCKRIINEPTAEILHLDLIKTGDQVQFLILAEELSIFRLLNWLKLMVENNSKSFLLTETPF